jgi:hypothetical protein
MPYREVGHRAHRTDLVWPSEGRESPYRPSSRRNDERPEVTNGREAAGTVDGEA